MTKPFSLRFVNRSVLITGLTLAWLSASTVWAQEKPKPQTPPQASPLASPLAGLIEVLRVTGLPNLSKLIQPEKMGVLSDNPLTVRDNPVDIDVDVNLLSGNETNVLSGIRILSGITVNVEVHIHPSPPAAAETPADRAAPARRAGPTPESRPARAERPGSEGSTR
ncbi:MAG: hypothetical protein EA424_18080 [Planctomycetaceae bacterium]|nr:MAG: hypothetical protein EA424_18080 [Planctomycetaceae bacterium]